jgi:hypothetical protein
MDGDRPKPDEAEIERLAEDWITLWQSEIAALAADREAAEGWAAAASAWAALGAAWMRAAAAPPFGRPPPAWPFPGPFPGAFAHDGAAAPPRPPAAAAAPAHGGEPGMAGAGRDDDALRTRLAELERRLSDLEGGPGGAGKDPRPPRRRKPRT